MRPHKRVSIRRILKPWLPGLALACFLGALRCPAQQAATVAKIHHYAQTFGPEGMIDNPALGPWTLDVQMGSSAAGLKTFTGPGGVTQELEQSALTGNFEYLQNFGSLADLDAAYPDGNYRLGFNGRIVVLSMVGGAYPNIPVVQMDQGIGGPNRNFVFDPTLPLTLTLNFTGNYLPGHAYMELDVSGANFPTASRGSAGGGALDLTLNQVVLTIPANSFPPGAPGPYLVDAYLGNLVSVSASAVPGFTVATLYENHTQLYLVPSSGALPVIAVQPQSQTIAEGAGASFSVEVRNASGARYQWMRNGTPVDGATAPNFSIPAAQKTDAAAYTVEVIAPVQGLDNPVILTSAPAELTVASVTPPTLPGQPVSVTIAAGGTAVFSVTAAGASHYQWLFQPGSDPGAAVQKLPGATRPLLVLSNAASPLAGRYSCVASNAGGSVESRAASLNVVTTANPGRLRSLSVLSHLGPKLSLGFVLGGQGTAGAVPLLIRGVGPSLNRLGLPDGVSDPVVTLIGKADVIDSNDNWGEPASNADAVIAAEAVTSAFPLSDRASHDAALVTRLFPNPGYIVQVSDKGGRYGAALAEVYDATPAAETTPNSPRLISFSSLSDLGPRETVAAGFVVGGSTAKTVLIRVLGPALADVGVDGAIADPKLTLSNTGGPSPVLVASDAGWGREPEINAIGAGVGALTLRNPQSPDCAVLVTVAPGTYTVRAQSASGAAGKALVEVFEVP